MGRHPTPWERHPVSPAPPGEPAQRGCWGHEPARKKTRIIPELARQRTPPRTPERAAPAPARLHSRIASPGVQQLEPPAPNPSPALGSAGGSTLDSLPHILFPAQTHLAPASTLALRGLPKREKPPMQNRPPKHMHRTQDTIIRENPATSLRQAERRNVFFSTFYFQKQTHAWRGGMKLAWDGGASSQPHSCHFPHRESRVWPQEGWESGLLIPRSHRAFTT